MNLKHCNECGGTLNVRAVSVVAEGMAVVPGTGVSLAKADNRKYLGDLCEKCLGVVAAMLEAGDLGLALVEQLERVTERVQA